ncbi:Hypothetical protein D9617_4g000410 [Elsinoe fawcettii]|nr:Hypothetical protein D9617_4g000410 [Elsinoe fawcettii]
MGPKRNAPSAANKRARPGPETYAEPNDDDEQPDPGREESEYATDDRAVLAKSSRDNSKNRSKGSIWAMDLSKRIKNDEAELLKRVDELEHKRLAALDTHKQQLVSLAEHLKPTFRPPLPSSESTTAQTIPKLDPTSTTLLASCTSLLNLYRNLNTQLSSISSSARQPEPGTPALPTPTSLTKERSEVKQLLTAGYRFAAKKISNVVDREISVLEDSDSATNSRDRKEAERSEGGRVRRVVVDGRLISVFDEEGIGKENQPPMGLRAQGRDGEGEERQRSATEQARLEEEMWVRHVAGQGHAGGSGADKEEEADGDIRTALRDVQKGAKRMLRNCPRGEKKD